MFNPFGLRPLEITSDFPNLELSHPKHSQQEPSIVTHESLCPCNPFSTWQSQTEFLKENPLSCTCRRIDSEGMKILKEINDEFRSSETTFFPARDSEFTEPQAPPTILDSPPKEGKWITPRPRRNARTPRNKPLPGKEVRVVTTTSTRETFPVTAHYPYSENYRPCPYNPQAHADVRWDPEKKARQIHSKTVSNRH